MSEDERVAWLREQIAARQRLAQSALDDRGEWSVTRNDDFDYTVFPRRPAAPGDAVADAWREDIAKFIAANDPQQVIADCIAQLAVITRCEQVHAAFHDRVNGMYPDVSRRERSHAEMTVADIAHAYRHKPGYAEHWGDGNDH